MTEVQTDHFSLFDLSEVYRRFVLFTLVALHKLSPEQSSRQFPVCKKASDNGKQTALFKKRRTPGHSGKALIMGDKHQPHATLSVSARKEAR